MYYLSSVAIVANVREEGAIGKFERRTFDVLLDQRQPEDRQLREAIRMLRGVGYETRGVHFAPNPGN